MNKLHTILLRLFILTRRKFGYQLPQLNEARPIKTHWWSIYRHHGRLIRLVPMSPEEIEAVEIQQRKLDDDYVRQELIDMEQWIEVHMTQHLFSPNIQEREKWQFEYELEKEKPEYRPCEHCVFSIHTPGPVIPCPYYNVVAGSTRHACCTHKYQIIKDVVRQ